MGDERIHKEYLANHAKCMLIAARYERHFCVFMVFCHASQGVPYETAENRISFRRYDNAKLAQLTELASLDLERIIQTLCEKYILVRIDTSKTIALLCDPGALTLLNVIAIMEGSAEISGSLEDEKAPADDIDHELRRLHKYVQKGIERCYGAVTISDVVDRAAARTKQAETKRLAAEQKAKERASKLLHNKTNADVGA